MPFEIAQRLPPWKLLAYQVITGELKGGRFDWDRLRWRRET